MQREERFSVYWKALNAQGSLALGQNRTLFTENGQYYLDEGGGKKLYTRRGARAEIRALVERELSAQGEAQ